MCRAIWVLIYAGDPETGKRIRRAAGADVQVVGMAIDTDELTQLIATTKADVILVASGAPRAREIVPTVASADRAVVWIGGDAPPEIAFAVEDRDAMEDSLPGAITKALIARKR
jgi:CMP-2-keto-3-deoxyoctulosonic acid synthetase